MTIDKSWTTLANRRSDEFWDGLNNFIEIAKQHVDGDGLVRCPCMNCLNMLRHTPDTVHAHIYSKGFQQSYQRWIFHGEVDAPIVEEVAPATDANRYSSAKCKYHTHFNKHGGSEDVNNARKNPPKGLKPAWWNEIIDRIFLNPHWQHLSKKNSVNRSKLPYNSFHGSRSYVNTRFKKMNPETNKIQSAIDNWHDMHFKPTNGWVNEQAKDDYEKLVAEMEIQTQQESSNPDGSSSLNEQEVFKKVFGERRGHNIGQGRKLKRVAQEAMIPSSSTTSTPISHEMVQDMVRAAQEACDKHRDEQDRKRYQDLATYFSSMIPNSNLANLPPFVSTPTPPFDFIGYMEKQKSQQTSVDEEEDSNDGDDDDE